MAFRSCGKSTIIGLFAAWLLLHDSNLRILVLSADTLLARKMVRNVKRIIERHPLTAHLKPERLDQWGADRFTVKRSMELRDPSMLARGIAANMTGSRADVVICDDVEVPKTCDTAEKRENLRDKLAEIDFILTPSGTQIYAGTPHHWHTIYTDAPRTELGETAAFLQQFKCLVVPILNTKNESAWAERFSLEEISAIRLRSGPNRFASQMMLQPVNISDGKFDVVLLRRYTGAPVYSAQLKGLYLNEVRLVSASAWWDPAFGKAGGDASVLAVVFADEGGGYWIQSVTYISSTPHPTSPPATKAAIKRDRGEDKGGGIAVTDEATWQCRIVAQIAKDLLLPSVTVEINGIGKFLPAILRREMARMRVPCAVREAVSTKAKDLRILEAFDAPLAARMIHAHDSVYQTPFIRELQEWRPYRTGGRDDGLDAVAGALSLEPVRILSERYTTRLSWRGGGSSHTADSEFEV
jgi:hypothetical protein